MVVLLDLDDESPDGNRVAHPEQRMREVMQAIRRKDATWGSVDQSEEGRDEQECNRSKQGPDATADAESHDASEKRVAEQERPNPNLNSFSQALSCYPVVSQLATELDLNTLHALSRTCRQFRANLLQYCDQLVARTLRCSNEKAPPALRVADALRASHAAWLDGGASAAATRGAGTSRMAGGRVGVCARDMVGECRRCGKIVCRNCTAKPPPPAALPGRLRRLCRTCLRMPLSFHVQAPVLERDELTLDISRLSTPHSSPRATPSGTPPRQNASLHTDHYSLFSKHQPGTASSSSASITDQSYTASYASSQTSNDAHNSSTAAGGATATTASPPTLPAFTSPAFQRTPCSCPDIVFLCQACGHSLRADDTAYMRGWTWRTRYSTALGGCMGTGIGEGLEGVHCGRQAACAAARDVEREIDCDAEELAAVARREEERARREDYGGAAELREPSNDESVVVGGGGGSASGLGSSTVLSASTSNLLLAGSPGCCQRRWSGGSYMTQEREGVGGVVKKTVKKREQIGAVVREYEDEREQRRPYLDREVKGEVRSWCHWCKRVVPGERDRLVLSGELGDEGKGKECCRA
ncbi:hypothetical protein BDY21DRAFT_362929 [Lineolata rhizophorae]|uniref:F-box domain-containing protein n=1 Tax=Lineolata rhizophorae TaxID=578093 RepID=A0A6A6P4L1_9PEZI|nr:hypothetical protein BDY21DRAFT_362929 [Lineolata rhizophorae]